MTDQCQAGCDNQHSEQDLGRHSAYEKINNGGDQHQNRQLHRMKDSVKRDHSCQPPAAAQHAAPRRTDILDVRHLRHAGVVAGDMHQVVLHLVQGDK